MSELASKFSDRHANEIKAEGAAILRAEIVAEQLADPAQLGRAIMTNPGVVVEAVKLLKQCAGIARQYHLAATAEDASSRLTGVA